MGFFISLCKLPYTHYFTIFWIYSQLWGIYSFWSTVYIRFYPVSGEKYLKISDFLEMEVHQRSGFFCLFRFFLFFLNYFLVLFSKKSILRGVEVPRINSFSFMGYFPVCDCLCSMVALFTLYQWELHSPWTPCVFCAPHKKSLSLGLTASRFLLLCAKQLLIQFIVKACQTDCVGQFQ